MSSLEGRRTFLKHALGGAAACSLLTLNGGLQAQDAGRPNILFIMVDDLRPALGCYGDPVAKTPNMDRLAQQGIVFERTFCQYPVCGPTRAGTLAGARPTRERFSLIGGHPYACKDMPNAPTLGEHFKNHGYTSISNGKVFHHADDSLEAWSEPPWRADPMYAVWVKPENKEFKARRRLVEDTRRLRWRGPAWEAGDVLDDAYPDGVNAEKHMKDLKRLAAEDKPFILFAGFEKPHLPFNCPKKYWDLYDLEEIQLADNMFLPENAPDISLQGVERPAPSQQERQWFLGSELRPYGFMSPEGPMRPEIAHLLTHGYYACVSYIDAQIGKLLDTLDETGLSENTVIVLWGDHGFHLGENNIWGKHCLFEDAILSPLIMKIPGQAGGKRTKGLTEFVDIYPTLCDLAGLPKSAHLEGSSLVPLIHNPDRPWKKAAFTHYRDGISMRTNRYRYTEWRDDEGNLYARMLYDLQEDPEENMNIAGLPENTERVEKLHAMLKAGWKAAVPPGRAR